MKSFSGLVRYKDIEKLRMPNDTALLSNPFIPIEDMCIIKYHHELQVLEYVTLDVFKAYSFIALSSYRAKVDSLFHLKAYSCLNIECLDCGKPSSRLSSKEIGQLRCYECGDSDDVFHYDADIVLRMFSNATITKLYPRWRWK